MEEMLKKAAVPGALAFGGVKVGQMVAPAGSLAQLVGGIAGAILGAAIGLHLGKKAA